MENLDAVSNLRLDLFSFVSMGSAILTHHLAFKNQVDLGAGPKPYCAEVVEDTLTYPEVELIFSACLGWFFA
jgi:hypothetical protein